MKGMNKAKAREQPKMDDEAIRDTDSIGSSTPEITARSRQSLAPTSASKDDDKDQHIHQLVELLENQEQGLKETTKALQESQEREQTTSLAYAEISQNLTNSVPITPGPNVNKPRTQRPQDTAYQTAIKAILANALNETSKTDVNLPPNFFGDDDKWEAWYKQWRAYLQAKEWLNTAEHPEGPGAESFNLKINSKIYNTLINLCQKGKAIAYIEQAAEFDGRGAFQQLLLRYDCFSKQKLQTFGQLAKLYTHQCFSRYPHFQVDDLSTRATMKPR